MAYKPLVPPLVPKGMAPVAKSIAPNNYTFPLHSVTVDEFVYVDGKGHCLTFVFVINLVIFPAVFLNPFFYHFLIAMNINVKVFIQL